MVKDALNENGLSLLSANDIRNNLVESFKGIYGSDINLDSNTQDGQIIDIITQMSVDLRELYRAYYNSMNPDMCRGSIQDVRFRINNLWRKGGSFTIVPMTLVISKTVELEGLDANYNDVNAVAYGVVDDSGNTYYLIDSETFPPGTYIRSFRADNYGDINPVVGTIVNQQRIVKGVDRVSNDSAAISVGVEEEFDEAFAKRRQKSIERGSQSSADALRAQILNIEGVTDAFVYEHDYENYPNVVDADGILPGYIWVIVEGGSNEDIGAAIYAHTSGCGTKGEVSVETITNSGQKFVRRFDRVVGVPLHIKFSLQETVKDTVFDMDGIKQSIADLLIYETYELAETSKVTEIARIAIDNNGGGGVPVNVEISLNGEDYVDYIANTNKLSKFTVDASRIVIEEINL